MCMHLFWPRSGSHAYQMAWHMASWPQLHATMPEVASEPAATVAHALQMQRPTCMHARMHSHS